MNVSTEEPRPALGDLAPADFLRDYWQKRPLVIRDAVPDFSAPLTPEELAGLALEDDVESRLVLEEGGAYPWELRNGSFTEDDFLSLPATHWTLLVQEVDRLVPDVGRLLERFRFIPDWRVDDVMVSYAPEGGGVGAHIDRYDVFLVQGLGRRRWRIGHQPVADETLVPDLDVRILADFEADDEYVLGPGDLLYLPPRIAHEGVALDDCMTFSVGFRAPSHEELLLGFLTDAAMRVDPEAHYADPGLAPADHPGEIRAGALEKVRAILRAAVQRDADLDDWFGRFITEPKRRRFLASPEVSVSEEALSAEIRGGQALRRRPAARLAFVQHEEGTATLFAAGRAFPLEERLAFAAALLTSRAEIPAAALAPHLGRAGFAALLAALVEAGVFSTA